MAPTASRPDQTARAPEAFRDAAAELVQIGMIVARMLGRVAEAEAEAALAVSAPQTMAGVDNAHLAGSLAEAIEVGRAADAAIAAQQTVAARAETVARAFRLVSRSVRMTVLLAERLDRGWARRGVADDRHAMARRQIARAVADAIGRDADGERAERLTEALAERMERLDVDALVGDRPVEEIIAEICRDIGLDAARMTVRPPLPGVAGLTGEEVAALLDGSRPGDASRGDASRGDARRGDGARGDSGRGPDAGPERRPPDG